MGRGTPGAPGLSQDARNRILHLALPSHHSWLHREETEAQKGAGVAQVCSPLLCHMRTSQGQQQSLLCSEAARWRPSDAPWWNFLLERPGQFLPSPGIPSPGTTLPWGPPSEGPLSQGTPLPQSHLLALLPCCQWSLPHPSLCHTCPGGEADSLIFLGLPPGPPVYLWGAPGGGSSLLPSGLLSCAFGGAWEQPPEFPVAGLEALAVAGDPSGQPGCVVCVGVLTRALPPRWCTTSLPS